MTTSCKVSFIVPCFNHGEFLTEAVASVMATDRQDIELIVVDDGSTDARTALEMDRLEAQGNHVIRQKNKGLAAARNAAISIARGEYVFPLDADDRLCPGWIDRAIQILDTDVKIGVVYGDAECFGTRVGRWEVGAFDPDRLLNMSFIHASALYRRCIWEQNGGYDGTMPVQGMEDWDFWIGALEHGWQFVYVPEIFFEYRQATVSMVTHARGSLETLVEFVARKHGPMYRRAWLRLGDDQKSIRKVARNLVHLLRLRVKQKLSTNARSQ